MTLIPQQPLSLITLDIMLADIDGWEFLSGLKKMPDLRLVPIAIVSIAADVQRGVSLGAAAVMQKPISRQDLHEMLMALGLSAQSPGRAVSDSRKQLVA
jgi:CheY-like chemotaxis protein